MSFIYHLKPQPMQGKCLIPLNQMDRDSELYKSHAKKYEGREDLMNVNIPVLNCNWNDVIHFSAINPQMIVNYLKNVQPQFQLLRTEYYKINIEIIKRNYDVVIFHRKLSKLDDYTIMPGELSSINSYIELSALPNEAINYWNRQKESGGKFLWFMHIPHVLVKGSIDVSGFEVCHLKLT